MPAVEPLATDGLADRDDDEPVADARPALRIVCEAGVTRERAACRCQAAWKSSTVLPSRSLWSGSRSQPLAEATHPGCVAHDSSEAECLDLAAVDDLQIGPVLFRLEDRRLPLAGQILKLSAPSSVSWNCRR
jgi:hypothetical protein